MKDIDDTKNLKDKQIAVRVPNEIIKWFGALRQIDLDTF